MMTRVWATLMKRIWTTLLTMALILAPCALTHAAQHRHLDGQQALQASHGHQAPYGHQTGHGPQAGNVHHAGSWHSHHGSSARHGLPDLTKNLDGENSGKGDVNGRVDGHVNGHGKHHGEHGCLMNCQGWALASSQIVLKRHVLAGGDIQPLPRLFASLPQLGLMTASRSSLATTPPPDGADITPQISILHETARLRI